MSYHFCTITTFSHLYKVLALYDSLSQLNKEFKLHVLIVDNYSFEYNKLPNNVIVHFIKDIKEEISKHIFRKYKNNNDKLRWSFKPVILKHIISVLGIEKVIYVDNDIAFFNDYTFLFDELAVHNVLLSPHNYSRNPQKNQNWLEANFRVGLYNAGFLGVNKNAIHVLDWWAECCLYRCEKNMIRGLFDDQKYLDLFPIIEPNTLILSHKGCNVAEWNREICERTNSDNGVMINGKWNIVFIHFNKTTIQSFIANQDQLLQLYYEKYISLLKKYNSKFNINVEGFTPTYTDRIKLFIWKILNVFNKN
jgi:hypothetical protein